MLGICRMLLRDPVEAEDAAQQTFLSAYRSLLSGNAPEHPAAWLTAIARNECWSRTQQRMRQPIPEPVADELASPLPGPVEAAARSADLAALVSAIGALPPQQRDALLMREFSGMSYAQLAEALSVTEPAVESLLVRARRELRARLQPVYATAVGPVFVLRDWLGRIGASSEPGLAAAAKIGGASLAAKVAASVATVAVMGGVVAGGDRIEDRTRGVLGTEAASVLGVSAARAGVPRVQTEVPSTLADDATSRRDDDSGHGSRARKTGDEHDASDRSGPSGEAGEPESRDAGDDHADDGSRSSEPGTAPSADDDEKGSTGGDRGDDDDGERAGDGGAGTDDSDGGTDDDGEPPADDERPDDDSSGGDSSDGDSSDGDSSDGDAGEGESEPDDDSADSDEDASDERSSADEQDDPDEPDESDD